ncbi:TetR/AcrR family transcriptional regulator [Pseudonocardia sp. TRM90224]|uniref:TetR/AcrR family transcriptional regulator n=1 Tax=Pseudonocardia sp. TRM90224 TaxID=2812678 RepID=UPI001E64D248|nr:TetR family transcriptional regulator [Pseudonocardia sp. TRM90224]
MEQAKRAGRWRSGQESRQRILDAARGSFALNGYDRTSVRAVAAEANVDQAMVFYFFGSKQGLFTEAMQLPGTMIDNLDALFRRPPDDFGSDLVRAFLNGITEGPLFTLTRSAATHDPSADLLRQFLDREIGDRLAARLDRPDARLRVTLVSAQLLGLAVARYVVEIEPVASASVDDLVALYGPAVQSLLDLPA